MRLFVSSLNGIRLLGLSRGTSRYLCTAGQSKLRKSYSFGRGTIPFTCATLGDILNDAADTCGDQIAIISAEQNISKTFLEFRNEADRLASGFIACGLQKGDRIAIQSPNCYEWTLAKFAAAKAGLILVNVNPALQAKEVENCLKNVRCKGLISFDKLKKHDYYEVLNEMLPELKSSDALNIRSKNLSNLKTIIMISDDHKSGTIRFKDLLNYGTKDSDKLLSQIENQIQCDDPVNIQFTSGTTGKPKAAVLSHHGMINNILLCGKHADYDVVPPIICCAVPMFHCFGCVLSLVGSVIFKGICILPSIGYDASANLQSIEKYKCNIVYGTPTMFVDLIKTQEKLQADISSLTQALIGGSAATHSVLKSIFEGLKVKYVTIGYGLTENSPTAALKRFSEHEVASQGFLEPLSYVELKVVDNKRNIVPLNTEGELCTRGFNLFKGYWEDEEKSKETVDENNWFYTGDLGVMNESGYIKIVGRIKDMVIRGGENIYVAEVEDFLNSHPAIEQVNVVGVPDVRLGEELCCWIKVKPDADLTEEDVREFCKGKISYYKIPRYIMFVKEFPTTGSGKIMKTEIINISRKKFNL